MNWEKTDKPCTWRKIHQNAFVSCPRISWGSARGPSSPWGAGAASLSCCARGAPHARLLSCAAQTLQYAHCSKLNAEVNEYRLARAVRTGV